MTRKSKFRPRGLVAFIVFGGFAVMTVTGLVLFITPPGRVAYWTNWALVGLEKSDWAAVHIVFSLLFVLAGAIHLFFNWKPFKHYLVEKFANHLKLRAESVIGTAAVGVILVGTLFAWPPFSWIINLNETLKDSWAAAGWAEPPFGHAEDVSLKVLGIRTAREPRAMMEALRDAGYRVDSPGQRVQDIATANGVTPALLWAAITERVQPAAPEPVTASITGEEVELRYSGTGLGQKTVAEIAETTGVPLETMLTRLQAAGIDAAPGDKMKAVAKAHDDMPPIDVLKVMLDAKPR
jgi:hypothetical protein